ncbi:MAG TPA: DedA family protein [Vicinamibacterales bacterium]|nr:DedA family protein [Vicinamibacterales bacterium]
MPAWVTDLFARYGYAVVFFGVFLENAGLPVPGETMVLAGGALAHFGQLSLPWVIAVAIVAATLGDNLGFAIGRKGGRQLLTKYGGRIGITRAHLAGFDRYFDRHGAKTVLIARFITGLRVFCAILAGGSDMAWPTFLVFNAAGAVLWSTTIALVGYFLGQSWQFIERLIGGAGLAGLVAVVALAAFWFLRLRRQTS